MSSKTLSAYSKLEERSADLVAPFARVVSILCARPKDHARFLNMLSLLEHIGSRKILSSQMRGSLGVDVLKHLAEETRHAYFFKRHAERLAGASLDYADGVTMAATAAKMYFGRLDAAIGQSLGRAIHREVPYLYVSMIVELRAIWTYGAYHRLLEEGRVGISLKSVLAEEELHLPQMAEALAAHGEVPDDRATAFVELEDRLFRTLWRAIEADVLPLASAA
jgi:hypothetical protein